MPYNRTKRLFIGRSLEIVSPWLPH